MRNVLIVYAYHRYPVRKALWNHLYCFEKSPQCRAYYINLRYRSVPDWLLNMQFDAVIFETTFTGQRWGRDQFRKVARKAAPLKRIDAPKYIIPQDEFLSTDLLCEFIEEFGIDRIYSALPEYTWETIYGSVYPEKTDARQMLTGYLDDGQIDTINRLAGEVSRELDIAYRASSQPWFGRHGMKKSWVADRIAGEADKRGLKTDISGEQKTEKDRLHGDDWFRFLLSARYTIGVEGGTSIFDRDGSIREKTEAYVAAHPDASFEDVERACFPGEDGKYGLLDAVSPRHLEACATRTCQILMESTYTGVLRPGVHYIELKSDYSNLDEVLDVVESDEKRKEITDRAYRDVVESGDYAYDVFVKEVLSDIRDGAGESSLWQRYVVYPWMKLRDRLSWSMVWFVDTFFSPRH